jgi:hypothetical protein
MADNSNFFLRNSSRQCGYLICFAVLMWKSVSVTGVKWFGANITITKCLCLLFLHIQKFSQCWHWLKIFSMMEFKLCLWLQGDTPYSLLQSHKNAPWVGKKVHDKIQEMSGSKRRNPCYRITRDKVSEPSDLFQDAAPHSLSWCSL